MNGVFSTPTFSYLIEILNVPGIKDISKIYISQIYRYYVYYQGRFPTISRIFLEIIDKSQKYSQKVALKTRITFYENINK